MAAALSVSSTMPSSALSTFTVALDDDTWTAGTSGKKFGTVKTMPTTSATAMSTYFQRGYRFMSRSRPLQRFDRALGQQLGHGAALHHDLGPAGDLDGQVLLADLRDLAEHAARGDDLVAFLQRFEHCPRFLRFFLLRPDQQEVENDENGDHRQKRHQVAAERCGRRGRTLGVRRGDHKVDQHVRSSETGGSSGSGGAMGGVLVPPGEELGISGG